MTRSNMAIQIVLIRASELAVRTLERFRTGVFVHMRLQMLLAIRAVRTELAIERFCRIVSELMSIHMRLPIAFEVALITLERFDSFVLAYMTV